MKNKIVYILGVVAIIMISIVVVLLINNKDFVAPEIDKNAKDGIPNYVEELGYKELKMSDDYNISIAGKPKLNGKYLSIYFTSDKNSKYLFKLRLYKNNYLIAETGVIEPGTYIEKIKVNNSLSIGDEITYRVMGYEYDTYYSAGEVSLNTKVW